MKLDRNESPDGSGKYALVNMREIRRIGGVKGNHNPDIAAALRILETNGLIDYGQHASPSEFFVIRLKDKYAYKALTQYARAAADDDDPDLEYAQEILDLSKRAGQFNPWCKRPD